MHINCLELFKDDDKNMVKFVILLVERGTSLQMEETEWVKGRNTHYRPICKQRQSKQG